MKTYWLFIIVAIVMVLSLFGRIEKAKNRYQVAMRISEVITIILFFILIVFGVLEYQEYDSGANSAPFWITFLPIGVPLVITIITGVIMTLVFRGKSRYEKM